MPERTPTEPELPPGNGQEAMLQFFILLAAALVASFALALMPVALTVTVLFLGSFAGVLIAVTHQPKL